MNEMKLTVRRADEKEITCFYGWMKKQFHPGELKSLEHIMNLRAAGKYAAFGLWVEEELIAYALMGHTADERAWLLDYYAVLPQYQNAGLGGRFLHMLQEKLDTGTILLEVEDPDYAPDETEKAHWQRRIRFYERNDCLHTNVTLNLWGFDYALMQLPVSVTMTDREVRAAMEEIYHRFTPQKLYEENVHFREDA